MPRGHLAPCAGCGVVRDGKVYVRVGQNREAAFCPDCLAGARAAAVERGRRNARRFARAVYLASRRAA